MLVACAGVLQVAESLLPHPLPGVRLGLANIITLIALVRLGARSAVGLAVLRTVVGSLVMGTFLTPTFVLSVSGGVVSALVMTFCWRLSARMPAFSYVGISVAGSVSHVLTQVALVYLLFIRSAGVLSLWPWLVLFATATGVLTGLVAVQALRRLAGLVAPSVEWRKGNLRFSIVDLRLRGHECRVSSVDSTVHRLPPDSGFRLGRRPIRSAALKVGAVVVVAGAVTLSGDPRVHAGVLLVLLGLALAARLSWAALGRSLLRFWPLLATSLVLPALFSPWGRVLVSAGPLRLTEDGLRAGAVFASRLGLLFLSTTVLALTTPAADIASGLERLLAPLRRVGVRSDRIARSLALSWSYFPLFWQHARREFGPDSGRSRERKGWLNRIIHLPGDLVADLYRLAEQTAAG